MAVTPARRAVPDVRPIFLDTAYINALVNTRDQWHEAASRWEGQLAVARRRLITTEFVLIEIADGLSAVVNRALRYTAAAPSPMSSSRSITTRPLRIA
jgi:hypothetical protein